MRASGFLSNFIVESSGFIIFFEVGTLNALNSNHVSHTLYADESVRKDEVYCFCLLCFRLNPVGSIVQ